MILAVEDVHTSYGLSQILFGVSLHVDAGECVSLLGRNGVGRAPRCAASWVSPRHDSRLLAFTLTPSMSPRSAGHLLPSQR